MPAKNQKRPPAGDISCKTSNPLSGTDRITEYQTESHLCGYTVF